ncbi:MAG: PorP/SprF family type IX secretion system membrane protein [Salibacteraceae bacterium]
MSRLLKYSLAVGLLLSWCFGVWGQDIHFSQFYSSPLHLNPALAGAFEGDYRFVANQRRQWGAVTQPFQTFGLSADASELGGTPVGVGLSFFNDRAGDSFLSTTQINLAGSFTLALPTDSSWKFSLGAQTGYIRRQIDFSELQFDQQYNGLQYDPNASNGEAFPTDALNTLNLNLGFNIAHQRTHRKQESVGLALFNLHRPQQSFLENSNIVLDRRFVALAKVQRPITDMLDVIPAVLFMRQGPHSEVSIGTSLKYLMDTSPLHYRALYIGGWTRARDAGMVSAGMDYDRWHVGLSYDINYSGLSAASNGRGGWEVALIYILSKPKVPDTKRFRQCPLYL